MKLLDLPPVDVSLVGNCGSLNRSLGLSSLISERIVIMVDGGD